MSQLIDFSNYHPETSRPVKPSKTVLSDAQGLGCEDTFKLTLNILIQGNPNKLTFTMKEVAMKLNVGEEFIRRRIKNGKINATYFGDKPMIHITELARILTEGIK